MDVSLESALSSPEGAPDPPGTMAGRSFDEWNAAYSKVESYFHALRVRNKVLLGGLVIKVLRRAMQRAPQEPQRSASELAAEETDRIVTEWFGQVMQETPQGATQVQGPLEGTKYPGHGPEQVLSTRGRLALLLADMPGKWQDQFLRSGPWPEAFAAAMRESYLHAGPNFQLSQMTPRQLDLGPITTLANMSRLPYAKMIAIWGFGALLLVAIFVVTHRFWGYG